MSQDQGESVVDRKGILASKDHLNGLERIALRVEAIDRPFASVARITGRIDTAMPDAWAVPNVAVRMEVASPEGQRPVSRIYTLRNFDRDTGRMEIDFVLHGDESPAMRWLSSAGPGTEILMTGPRPHFLPHHAAGRAAAVLADETAIPALAPILAGWPEGAAGLILVETADPSAFEELAIPAGVEARLLLRAAHEEAGTTGRLVAAAKALPAERDWTIWAAGERGEMREIRNHFLGLGMSREDLRVEGYWKHGVSSTEIDRARLKHYEELRASGKGLADFDSSELAI